MKSVGHTCPDCEAAFEQKKAVGPGPPERACAAGWDRLGRPDRAQSARDHSYEFQAWAAIVAEAVIDGEPAPEPPDQPWVFQTGWPDEEPVETDPVLSALQVLRNARERAYRSTRRLTR